MKPFLTVKLNKATKNKKTKCENAWKSKIRKFSTKIKKKNKI